MADTMVRSPGRTRRSLPGPPVRRRGSSGLARSQRRWGYVFAAPAVLGFAVFTLGPMIASLVISLTDWRIGGTPRFIGLDNYGRMLDDPLFSASLKATGFFAVLAVPAALVTAFLAALLLNQVKRFRSFFRTVFYLPVLVPPVASAVLWLWMFNPDLGLLNTVLKALGLPTSAWLSGDNTVMPSLALMAAWSFGNTALIFLAGLQGVSQQLYEAAAVDGAGPLRRMWTITIPSISPIILFNLITGTIAALQVFDQAYVMTGGGPNNRTLFYVFYLYNKAFTEGQLGYAGALAWFLFLVVLVLTVLIFRAARRWVYYEGADQ
jgi:multiple sugar transport system permease protein